MRVHHMNCGTLCPSARMVQEGGSAGLFEAGRVVCHCMLVETNAGLVLVDTGLGLDDVADPSRRLGASFVVIGKPRLDPDECAVRQIERLGFKPSDVRHIVVTHLDYDHAGGLPDFPKAKVHVFAREHEAAMARATYVEQLRYRPVQWAHGVDWELHETAGDRWLRFESVRAIPGTEVLLIPMIGHTRGHSAVAVETASGWILYAGDAYYDYREMTESPVCSPGFALLQRVAALDNAARIQNQARLRELARDHAGTVKIHCAHSRAEFDRCIDEERAAAKSARRAAQGEAAAPR
jgi:glyoxylase-like metal-dependent hydrolase (beta-lactamase superfamily II)